MKAVHGVLAAAVAMLVLAMPIVAFAHDGWHHDHGNHWGWYKHHGGYGYGGYDGYGGGGYPGYWDHHRHEWWEHHRGYGYGGYPGGMMCDEDGDDCRPAAPLSVPYGGMGYLGSMPYNGSGLYTPGYTRNMGKMMQLQQTLNQQLNANQALYQAAVAQGNYRLANKLATRMQYQAQTLNAANSFLGGAAPRVYPGYPQTYGVNPYAAQPGYSPLGSILQMFGY